MKTALSTDFSVDKENAKINVTRSFSAPLNLVWEAWTTAAALDKWWAPKPYVVQTKHLNFEAGGQWLYAMVSPEGEKHWCQANYSDVSPKTNFKCKDAFCDEEGNINSDFPQTEWNIDFTDNESSTTVEIELNFQDLAHLEQHIQMGFKEGFLAALQNLEELLAE